MHEGVVVGLPVEVLRLQYDAVAVEDQSVERPRRGSRGGDDERGRRTAEADRGGGGGRGAVAGEAAAS